MLGSKGGRPKALGALPDGAAERAAREVRVRGAIAIRDLSPVPLSRTALADLVDRLGGLGLERTGRFVRVPLAEQLDALLAERTVALQPAAALKRQLPGVGAAAEVKHVVAALVQRGRAAIAVRDGREHLARPSAALLEAAELAAVGEAAVALAKLVKGARPKRGAPPRTLFRADVARVLETLVPIGPPATAADPVDDVVTMVAALETPRMPLVPVPAVVRALAGRVPPEAVQDALLRAAREGRLELRPESGVGTLAPADALLCPRSATGDLLTYVRRVPR